MSERKALLAAVDLVILNGSLIASRAWAGPALDFFRVDDWILLLSAIWLITAGAFDCYQLVVAASPMRSLRSVTLCGMISLLAFYLIPHLAPELPSSRGVIAVNAILFLVPMGAWRLSYSLLLTHPYFRTRVLIVGSDPVSLAVEYYLSTQASSEYDVHARVAPEPSAAGPEPADQLRQQAAESNIHEIIVDPGAHLSPGLQVALVDLAEAGTRITSAREVHETLTGRVLLPLIDMDWIAGLPSHHGLGGLVKRMVDILLALVGLLLALPVLLITMIAIRIDSPGSALYRQERVGQHGRVFTLLKLRTMLSGSEQSGAVWAVTDDPRVTRVGRMLRRTRADELPQLWNVLIGDMSLVGPRPERPEFVSALSAGIPMYRARHLVRPGITGWAQVRFRYASSLEDTDLKLQYDLYYLRHWSLALDAVILLKTIEVVAGLRGT